MAYERRVKDPAQMAQARLSRAAEIRAKYDDPDADGRQAIIDLAMLEGAVLEAGLVARLEAAGYEVPDEVRPRCMD